MLLVFARMVSTLQSKSLMTTEVKVRVRGTRTSELIGSAACNQHVGGAEERERGREGKEGGKGRERGTRGEREGICVVFGSGDVVRACARLWLSHKGR